MSIERALEIFKDKAHISVKDTVYKNKCNVFSMRLSDARAVCAEVGSEARVGNTTVLSNCNSDAFAGMSLGQWTEECKRPDITFKTYEEAKERLLKDGITNSLGEILREVSPVRKRKLSEYDGEFDFSRRWELQPFMRTEKTNGDNASLIINCMISFNSGTSAHLISEYGAMVGAISSIIEGLGVKTKVLVCEDAHGAFRAGDKKPEEFQRIEFLVKDFNDYSDSAVMSTAFHSCTLRRDSFTIFAVAAESEGYSQCSSLGRAQNEPIFKPDLGEIYLNIDSVARLKRGDKKEIEKLTAAIKQQSWGMSA